MRSFLFLIVVFFFAKPLAARDAIASKVNVGLNLAPLYSGLPELQLDYFFNRYIGVTGSAGYLNMVRRGLIKVEENCTVTDAKGAYFKLGVKGRFVAKTKNRPVPWAQLLYVYSSYDERGYYEGDLGFPNDYRHYVGSSNGFVASIGADFPLWRRLDFRAGFQAGIYYHRDAYFGLKANTFQPGIGAEPGVFILGFNYRFGNLPTRTMMKKMGTD